MARLNRTPNRSTVMNAVRFFHHLCVVGATSLAIVYAEMLTGQHPFKNQGNLAMSAKRDKPMLDGLSLKEQDVIRRALDPDPTKPLPA